MLGGNGMPSRKKHTNPFLLLIAIAICLVLGVTLRQSNADFSVLSEKPSQSVASVSDSQEQNLILTRNPFHLPKLPHLLLQRSHLHLNAKFLMWQLPESGLPVEATGSLW